MTAKAIARPARNGASWTPERIQRLKDLYDAKECYEAIAADLGLNASSVSPLLSRFYPERSRRRALPSVDISEEVIAGLSELYGRAATYDEIAFGLTIDKNQVSGLISWLNENRPELMREVRGKRTAAFAEVGRDSRGRIRNWKVAKPREATKPAAYTPLDAAMDYLRKFAPCHRDKASGLIVYGNTRKTEDEIFEMVERKKRQAEAWKAGRL